ncbi:MAG: CPBP family intramembrane glutamic endopeptidase [Arenicellales bacterium]
MISLASTNTPASGRGFLLLDFPAVIRFLAQYVPPLPRTREQWGIVLLPPFIALILLLLDRYGLQDYFLRSRGAQLLNEGMSLNQLHFAAQLWFSGSAAVLFVLLPLVFHFLFPVSFHNSLGLSLRYCGPHWRFYWLLVLVMAPVLWVASSAPSFYHFYPMYKPVDLAHWATYEVVYLLQFVCVEFFFRGFALFRLESRFGLHAVTLMVIPYALIHIHKPLPEAVAAIVAGLVLGTLAIKSRSIWPGVLVHTSVAFMMDVFALAHAGRLAALF